MKGVAWDTFQFLLAKSSAPVISFYAKSQAFDEAHSSRLDGSAYHGMPNVVASFSSVTSANPDIRTPIAEVVHDGLCAVL